MRPRVLWAVFGMALLAACGKGPDVSGAWYYDYSATKLPEFPNPQYESARALIADIGPRYGSINVDNNTVVLGGAVCNVDKVNDDQGLICDERGQRYALALYLKDDRLEIRSQATPPTMAIFSRVAQDPYRVYGIDPNAKEVVEETVQEEKVAEPRPEAATPKLVGYAKTTSFNAFYDPASIKVDGRYTSVRILLNYLEPQDQGSGMTPAWSSVQNLTFDCPGSNYRLDRFVMYSDKNGLGAVVTDSGVFTDYRPEFKTVPENSVNKVLYMRVCR